jgi:hypothetical protein
MFDHFLGLRQLVKDEGPDEVEIAKSRLTFGSFLGFADNVMGMGCRPMGFSHV